ncbi:MAG TPA: glutathione S-transferase [Myxococcales bacterium]|nr:glutathione S-transferase [Myxococcales bacterium]
MPSLVVHHLERSRSHRALWLLEELGVDYEIVTYRRHPKTSRAPDSLRAIHPLGRAPLVELDGRVLAESGAILETLSEELGDGALVPARGTEAFRRFRFFMHFAEGSMMAPLMVQLVASRVRSAPVPFFLKPVVKGIAAKIHGGYSGPETARQLAFLDAELADRAWITGDDFSAADIQMSYPIEAALSRGDHGDVGHLRAYVERLRARPAYARAVDKGGPVLLGG